MAGDSLVGAVATLYGSQINWMQPQLRAIGLTEGAFQLLAAVRAMPVASQASVASRLGVAPATLSEAVREQVRLGRLRQEASTRDRRVKLLRLTVEGERLVDEARRIAQACDTRLRASIPAKQLRDAIAALERGTAALERDLE